MAVLKEEQLEKYFAEWNRQLSSLIDESKIDSIEKLIHTQMMNLMNAENELVKTQSNNGSIGLNIAPNGYPSIDSLTADLEYLSSDKNKELSCSEFAKQYNPAIELKPKMPGFLSQLVKEKEWQKETNKVGGNSKIEFNVKEKDGILNLTVVESRYREGFDEASLLVPYAIRKTVGQYHILWGNLMFDENSTFIINKISPKKEENLCKDKITYSDIQRKYVLQFEDYSFYYQTKGNNTVTKKIPSDFEDQVKSSHLARVNYIQYLLKMLTIAYDTEILLDNHLCVEIEDYITAKDQELVQYICGKEFAKLFEKSKKLSDSLVEWINFLDKSTQETFVLMDNQETNIGKMSYHIQTPFFYYKCGDYCIETQVFGSSITSMKQHSYIYKNIKCSEYIHKTEETFNSKE